MYMCTCICTKRERHRETLNTWPQSTNDAVQYIGIIYLLGKIQNHDMNLTNVRIP